MCNESVLHDAIAAAHAAVPFEAPQGLGRSKFIRLRTLGNQIAPRRQSDAGAVKTPRIVDEQVACMRWPGGTAEAISDLERVNGGSRSGELQRLFGLIQPVTYVVLENEITLYEIEKAASRYYIIWLIVARHFRSVCACLRTPTVPQRNVKLAGKCIAISPMTTFERQASSFMGMFE
ncbi:hypothetical protein BJV77DRAFT_961780 [Russula vinacea]|nr:hypothetical protein BJV77DRAFT_961780 [Russula vinacea]